MSKNSGCLAFTKRSTEIIHLRHNQYVFIIKIQIFAPPSKKVVTITEIVIRKSGSATNELESEREKRIAAASILFGYYHD